MAYKFLKSVIAAALLSPAASWSSPMIAVDSADADKGVLVEGKIGAVKHSFVIRNTGDSVLKIQSVRAG